MQDFVLPEAIATQFQSLASPFTCATPLGIGWAALFPRRSPRTMKGLNPI